MSLDLYFFKKGFDIQKSRADIDATYTKLQAAKAQLEDLEDAYDEAKLSSLNITHNLNKMAKEVGLYEVLWKPEIIGITIASQMIPFLEKGLKELEANLDKYKAFNPPNGFGSYEDFVGFCKSVLHNCHEYPDAVIEASA
ncbi:hypothetical protein EZS27_019865 [termite gut metagenome]|jgi:hypothetical protein|uniref:Uncharacterized protein n=1 Tax=termite gut metagenome TaxID=433724 RepID=A0A5J4RC04_9ZZZZ